MPTIADVEEGGSEWVKNALSIMGVCVVGAAGWAIAWKTGVWAPQPVHDDISGTQPMALGAQILGYASAVCYLGARIPQIIKNQRERSCEGLSLLFFMLSLLGNATYGAGVSLNVHSTERLITKVADPLPLPGKRIPPHQSPLAHRLTGHHGRRRHYIRAVSRIRQRGANFCC